MSCISKLNSNVALGVIDVQPDFVSGSLAVKGANEIFEPLTGISPSFQHHFCSLDCHPKDHCSFKKWPAHCVEGTDGQQLHVRMRDIPFQFTAVKGIFKDYDSYSAFYVGGNDLDGRPLSTGLDESLRKRNIKTLVLGGLALDFCVKATFEDAINLGYQCYVYLPGTRAAFNSEETLRSIGEKRIIRTWDEEAIQRISTS